MISKTVAVNPRDTIALRQYYEASRSQLATERSSWDGQWSQCGRYFMPRNQAFLASDVNDGSRQDFSIVDNTGTMALNVLAAGIFSSVSSPTEKWWHLIMADESLMANSEVAAWIEAAEEAIAEIMLRSNFYQTLLGCYREQALYGTTAFMIGEDPDEVIRCHPLPIGSYYISGDHALRVDYVMRIANKTVRQLVDEFGIDAVSDQVKTLYQSNAGGSKEQWQQVVHVVHRNQYYDSTRATLDDKPWVSVYYEISSYRHEVGILRRSGFHENPMIVGRWDTVGENFYGESAAMNALGDVKELQLLQKRKSQAVDKQVNPPMVGHPSLANQSMSVLPGAVTFADMRDGNPGFKAAYQVQFDLAGVSQLIQQTQGRINDALYKSLFLLNSESDRRQITAEEIRARQQEKMLVLGPVALRNDSEVLGPSVMRIFNIAYRAGKLPSIPGIMRGKPFRVQFESILAKAQKIQRTANIDRLMAFLGSEVAVNQGIMDNFDMDDIATDYAKMLGVPPNGIRDPDAVTKIRNDRAQQQQQQQQADNAQKLAAAGQTLSRTDVNSDSALTRLMPGLANNGSSGAGA